MASATPAGNPGPCKRPMTDWYDPLKLLRTGIEVLISATMGQRFDYRMMEDVALTQEVFDYSRVDASDPRSPLRDEIWPDYMGDTGDGWYPTHAIASLVAQPSLRVDGRDLPRGGRAPARRSTSTCSMAASPTIGLRDPLTAIRSTDPIWSVLRKINLEVIKKLVVIIVVDARNEVKADYDLHPSAPGLGRGEGSHGRPSDGTGGGGQDTNQYAERGRDTWPFSGFSSSRLTLLYALRPAKYWRVRGLRSPWLRRGRWPCGWPRPSSRA